jgi:molybdate transport system permease protein
MQLKNYFIGAAGSILLVYGLLIISAFYFFEWQTFTLALNDKRVLSAIWISISAASIATLLAVVIAIPAAYAMSRYDFKLKKTVDHLLELPMIVSPAALGALILILFQTPLGDHFRTHAIDIVYTFSGIVVAQFITILGISTRMLKSIFDEIPQRYEQIARTLGATPLQAFRQIALPLAGKGILSAVVLTWAKAIGEFGATITVAGSLTGKTETLPTSIFMRLSTADIEGTVVLIIILLAISMSLLIIARYFLQSNSYD